MDNGVKKKKKRKVCRSMEGYTLLIKTAAVMSNKSAEKACLTDTLEEAAAE